MVNINKHLVTLTGMGGYVNPKVCNGNFNPPQFSFIGEKYFFSEMFLKIENVIGEKIMK